MQTEFQAEMRELQSENQRAFEVRDKIIQNLQKELIYVRKQNDELLREVHALKNT